MLRKLSYIIRIPPTAHPLWGISAVLLLLLIRILSSSSSTAALSHEPNSDVTPSLYLKLYNKTMSLGSAGPLLWRPMRAFMARNVRNLPVSSSLKSNPTQLEKQTQD